MGLPKTGDRVVKVGQVVMLRWTSNDVSYVDIVLSNGTSSKVLFENQPTRDGASNAVKWTVVTDNLQQFAGTECTISISMDGNTGIQDISKKFWIIPPTA